jgi:PilZ domain
MQALAMEIESFDERRQCEPTRVWIESGDGSIARGVMEVLSADGACVRVVGADPIVPGSEVAVRMALSRSAPTLGARARILWVRSAGESVECELEWTHSGAEREQLARLVAALG